MPETFPNVSVSDLTREVQGHVDEALAGIARLEAEIKAEYERLRFVNEPSAAPSATESATDAPEVTTPPAAAPVDPPASEPAPPAEDPASDSSAPSTEGSTGAVEVPAA